MIHIKTKTEFVKFAARMGVRDDWHEPDEQEVFAHVVGNILDNAHGSTIRGDWIIKGTQEFVIILENEDIQYLINLADLLAWAGSEVTN